MQVLIDKPLKYAHLLDLLKDAKEWSLPSLSCDFAPLLASRPRPLFKVDNSDGVPTVVKDGCNTLTSSTSSHNNNNQAF
jgi:hypothetical protein